MLASLKKSKKDLEVAEVELFEAKKLVVKDLLNRLTDIKRIKREAKVQGNLTLAEEARLLIRSLQKKYKKALEDLTFAEENVLERERVKFSKKSRKTIEKEEALEAKRLNKKALKEQKILEKKIEKAKEKERVHYIAVVKRQKREDALDEAR